MQSFIRDVLVDGGTTRIENFIHSAVLSVEIEPQVMQRKWLSEFLRNSIKKIEKLDSRVVDEQGVRAKFGVAYGLLSCLPTL